MADRAADHSEHVVIVESPYGSFAVDTVRDRTLYKHFGRSTHHQLDSILLLKHFIGKDSVVVDAGAHIGTITIPLARWAKKVIAFEPSPITFGFLTRNIALNAIKNIEARNKGLGSKAGYAALDLTPEGNAGGQMLDTSTELGGAGHTGDISVATLDAEVPEADLIKIDVEGMEPDIFRGAGRLVREHQPVIFSEVNLYALRAHRSAPSEMQRFFKSHGYELFLPLERAGETHLGRISDLTLATILINPGVFIRGGISTTFDVLAVPAGYLMPPGIKQVGHAGTILQLISLNVADKAKRIKRSLSRREAKAPSIAR
jgi:FkbM family methyltransferase